MDVEPVEQRAGYAGEITRRGVRRAGTAPDRMAEIAARAGIHCADEHHAAGIGESARDAGDRDRSILNGLAQRLHRCAREFRQLVEKEHAVVRERNFPRMRHGAAAR